jgi:carboxyl-terminal processing protease
MEKRNRIIIWMPVFLALALIIGIWFGSKLQSRKSASLPILMNNGNKLSLIMSLIENNYVDTVDSKQLIEDAIPEVLTQLDPHTVYIPASDMQEVNEEMEGNFGGIGVQFSIQNDTVMVVDVISGGPSQKLGILAGDRIVMVNDTLIAGVGIKNDAVMGKLRGPKGTKVNVSIARKGFPELLPFEITRGEIPIYSVDVSYMIDSKTGFVKVGRFAEKTYEEFIEAMDKLSQSGAGQVIIDLRSNPGGYLGAVIKMVSEFLDKDEMVVYTQGRTQPKREYRTSLQGKYFGKKVIVLVDDFSASASEIFAGAIQDNDRGTIIGRRTFGKGLVQEQIPFYDGSAMRLTVARYYTPAGRCIQKPYDKGNDDYYEDISRRMAHGEFEQRDSIHYSDTLKYYTRKNRVVYGGGGIMPDIFVSADTAGISSYYTKITAGGTVNQFALDYADKHRNELASLKTGAQFIQYLKAKNCFSEFIAYAAAKGIPRDENGLKQSGKILETQMMSYIARNIMGEEGFYSIISTIDNTLQEAIKSLSNSQLLVDSK